MKTFKSLFLKIFVFTFLFLSGLNGAKAQTVDCAGTIRAWQIDVSLREYMATHTCRCPYPDRQPVCQSNSEPADNNPQTGVSNNPNVPKPPIVDPAVEQAKRNEIFKREKEELLKLLKRGTATNIGNQTNVNTNQTALPVKPGNAQNTNPPIANVPNNAAAAALRELTAKKIKELNCSAFWGLKAAKLALAANFEISSELETELESARLLGELSASAAGGKSVAGCPEVEIKIPDIPPPLDSNPQIQFYTRTAEELQFLLSDISITKRDLSFAYVQIESAKEDMGVNRDQKNVLDKKPNTPKNRAEKNKLDTEYDDLVKLARDYEAESLELQKTANEQKQKVAAIETTFETVSKQPERAKEFLKP